MRLIASLLFVAALSVSAQIPAGLYTLAFVEIVPGPAAGSTNWQVLIRTDTNALPVSVIETKALKVAVSNLQYGATYYLSAKAQSNGAWSGESDTLVWPHPRTNYVTTVNQTATSPNGNWADEPETTKTFVNLPYLGKYWRIKIWESNNLSPYIIPQ